MKGWRDETSFMSSRHSRICDWFLCIHDPCNIYLLLDKPNIQQIFHCDCIVLSSIPCGYNFKHENKRENGNRRLLKLDPSIFKTWWQVHVRKSRMENVKVSLTNYYVQSTDNQMMGWMFIHTYGRYILVYLNYSNGILVRPLLCKEANTIRP